jgi:hypothetical protein
MPIGIPGWPDLALWTASIDKNLKALIGSDGCNFISLEVL